MEFTTTEILNKLQTDYNAISASAAYTKEQKEVYLKELNGEKIKSVISNDAYGICQMIDRLISQLNKMTPIS